MHRNPDEAGRFWSYLIAVYEIIFGFIAGSGSFTGDMMPLLFKAAGAFLLAGAGLHFFVNLNQVEEGEYLRKRRALGLGLLALVSGIAMAVSVSPDAMTSHIFFLVYLAFLVVSFLYFGALRNIFVLGTAAYGAARLLAVIAGAVIAGNLSPAGLDEQSLRIMFAYGAFHVICEFLRWTAARKSTRLAIIMGFMLLLLFLTFMFYSLANMIDSIGTKLLVMALLLIVIVLVSLPPLNAIRSLKALPLLDIFPRGLAGGIVLTLICYVVLKKDNRLLLLIILPAFILAVNHFLFTDKGQNQHGVST